MKKSVMYSETRTWFFDLDMAEGADLDEVMGALKGTDARSRLRERVAIIRVRSFLSNGRIAAP